jgi:hypothetical protein
MDAAVQAGWIDYGVREYLRNAKRYRHELRRLDA